VKTIAILFLAIGASASAQVSGGGIERPGNASQPQGVLDDHRFFELGILTAGGTYGKLPQTGYVYYTETAATNAFSKGQGATSGYVFAFHERSYFKLEIPPQMRVGLDIAVTSAYVNVDWVSIYEDDKAVSGTTGDIMVDLMLGPMVSFSPVANLALDASFSLGYGMAGGSGVYVTNYPLSDGSKATVDDSNSKFGFGLANAFSLRIRYAVFTAAWETHSNSAKRVHDYYASSTNGNSGDFTYTVNNKMPTSRLTFGMIIRPKSR
jgi:hypothetical protein